MSSCWIKQARVFKGISKPRNEQLSEIFKRLGIVEQTGHGIPTIIKKYGREAFDIKDNYIDVIIPYNKEVLANHGAISGAISGVDSGLNENENAILNVIKTNPNISAKDLSISLSIPFRSVQRYISNLKEKGIIERVGSNKSGYWKAIK